MKIQVHFPGYDVVTVDTDDCDVFEHIDSSAASTALAEAVMGDEDEDGWVSAVIGGEYCAVRMVSR